VAKQLKKIELRRDKLSMAMALRLGIRDLISRAGTGNIGSLILIRSAEGHMNDGLA
jgi:hypothetical protein